MCATIRTKAIINRVLLIIIIQQWAVHDQAQWKCRVMCMPVVCQVYATCMSSVCQVYVVYAKSIMTLIDVLIEDGC